MFALVYVLNHWNQIMTALRLAAMKHLAGHVLLAMWAMAPAETPRLGPEPRAEMEARYQDIARDIAAAAYHPSPWEARRRASILLAIARHEAGLFERDVDLGPCITAAGHCDHGRSVGLWQLLRTNPDERRYFQTHRDAAAVEALRIALHSVAKCRKAPFAVYAAGHCDGGQKESGEIEGLMWRAMVHLERAQRQEDNPYSE